MLNDDRFPKGCATQCQMLSVHQRLTVLRLGVIGDKSRFLEDSIYDQLMIQI